MNPNGGFTECRAILHPTSLGKTEVADRLCVVLALGRFALLALAIDTCQRL
jgi:hypothetical protein